MSDNVRVGRESITKKISYHDKITRPYKTIESLEKEPTKKKIILNDYRLSKTRNIQKNKVILHSITVVKLFGRNAELKV
jgi:hypothetical protein